MFRKYEKEYNPKIDFKFISLINPKHDIATNYFEKVNIFKYDFPFFSEQGRWFKKIKMIYLYLVNNEILSVNSFELVAKELNSELDYEKIYLLMSRYKASNDIPYDATWLLKEIWKEELIGEYSYLLAILVMNSYLKKNNYIPIIFFDQYNSYINKLINENITTESLVNILSIYRDMSVKYIEKFELIDKKTILGRILDSKEILIKKYGVKTIWLFGSFFRDEANEYSDVDLYIEFFREKGEMDFLEVENYLKSILRRRVDMHLEREAQKIFVSAGKENREVVFDAD